MELLVFVIILAIIYSIPFLLAGTVFYGIYEVIKPFLPVLRIVIPILLLTVLGRFIWKKTHNAVFTFVSIIIVCAIYSLITEDGAVRLGVLRSGHPISAVSLTTKSYSNDTVSREVGTEDLRRITKRGPINKQGYPEDLWAIEKHLLVKIATPIESSYYRKIAEYSRYYDVYSHEMKVLYAEDEFVVHGNSIPKNTVVVIDTASDKETGGTRFFAYIPGNKIEDILYDNERNKDYYYEDHTYDKNKAIETRMQWDDQLPLSDPIYISAELFEVLDPVWSDNHLIYEDIPPLINDIRTISVQKE